MGCAKVEQGGTKMVVGLMSCVAKLACPGGAAALARKPKLQAQLKKKQEAMTHKVLPILGKVGCPKRRLRHIHAHIHVHIPKNFDPHAAAKKMACKILDKGCDPMCRTVVNVASGAAASMSIPLSCVSGSLKKACLNTCHKFCA